jgi:hypothetical protein
MLTDALTGTIAADAAGAVVLGEVRRVVCATGVACVDFRASPDANRGVEKPLERGVLSFSVSPKGFVRPFVKGFANDFALPGVRSVERLVVERLVVERLVVERLAVVPVLLYARFGRSSPLSGFAFVNERSRDGADAPRAEEPAALRVEDVRGAALLEFGLVRELVARGAAFDVARADARPVEGERFDDEDDGDDGVREREGDFMSIERRVNGAYTG